MKLYNTLSRGLQVFDNKQQPVKIYSCGPTVYDYQHVGNYSGYVYWDILTRLLIYKRISVKRVMNITDVGHLVSDEDEGEDKLDKGARREGKTARQVADFYTEDFLKSMKELSLIEPIYAKATDFIDEQQAMIKLLLQKDFAYQSEQAIYFDVTKIDDYGKLTGQKLADKEVAVRAEVVTDSNKRHPQDFALWFFCVGRFKEHEMRWPSPWGEGFPGWHIECSAIIHSILGDPIDIHTGGIDHIGTHHTNEIAQTEAAYDNQLSQFWLHNNHMMIDGKKISKSLGNGITLADLVKRGYSLMDYKLFVIQSHYRSQSNFTWAGLDSAKQRLMEFESVADLRHQTITDSQTEFSSQSMITDLVAELDNDLNTPGCLALLSNFASSIKTNGIAKQQLIDFLSALDDLLGLSLSTRPDVGEHIKSLINQRQKARADNDWAQSDKIREQLLESGISVNDTTHGTIWSRVR